MQDERRHVAWEERSFVNEAGKAPSPRDWEDSDEPLQALIESIGQNEARICYQRIEHDYQAWRLRPAAYDPQPMPHGASSGS
jgi:hypothetical protein